MDERQFIKQLFEKYHSQDIWSTNNFIQDVNIQPDKRMDAKNTKKEKFYAKPYRTYKSMIEEDKKNSNKKFPKHSFCPHRSLRKLYTPVNMLLDQPRDPNVACIPRVQRKEDCEKAVKYFGKPGTLRRRKCPKSEVVSICSIYKETTLSNSQFAVSCNFSKCNGKPVMVGFYNEDTGLIGTDDWSVVHDAKALKDSLRHHVFSSTFGRGFALLRCFGEHSSQVVTLPQVSQTKENIRGKKTRRVNINFILEDSLSRSHFYRTLPKTISAFRNIVYDQRIPATVLDFEMFQSTGSSTINNLQRLFSARKYVDTETKSYAVVEFFTKIKNGGFTTLFQDTNCWYDKWASYIVPPNQTANTKIRQTKSKKWENYKTLLQRYNTNNAIDDFGMTFLTCFAYEQLNVTNVFDGDMVRKVCFSGRDYSSLFLEYNEKYVAANDVSDLPFFSFTHLRTSHEGSGRRIVNDDLYLSELFNKAAYLSNTITIFASDHGGKSTNFAAYTSQGRHEVYEPLLFMIIPDQVGTQLGTSIMDALVANQNRLVTMDDLHHAFLSLLKPRQASTTEEETRGLFAPVPPSRQCQDLKLRYDVLCLCEGMEKIINNSSQDVMWAAEYVLGTINNRIQDQYIASLNPRDVKKSASHGACQRYSGLQIMRPRQQIIKDMESLQFSLFVKPIHLNTTEVFDVQVTFPVRKRDGIVLKDLERVSIYEGYKGCANGVDPKLCACSYSNYDPTVRWQNEVIATKKRSRFSLAVKRVVLDKPCLIILSRTILGYEVGNFTKDVVVTHEALNRCANRTYLLNVRAKKRFETRLSFRKSFTVIIYPRTIVFLAAVNNRWEDGSVELSFKFNTVA